MKDTLFVMALKQEAMGLLDALGADVIYTGIGKVNAAHALTSELTRRRYEGRLPVRVVNLGTAGSRCFRTGDLIACHQFVQRDMDVTPLGFAHGETPYETIPAMLETPLLFPDLTGGLCGSGDSFVTGALAMDCQVLDMEAYALAKVCRLEAVPFAAVKYITDGADADAAEHWPERLRHAAEAFAGFVHSRFTA
ncbi:5'-methylthioadenosine/S-adenosylhomocysteine nucleosidase family protein [Asticcacaulis sp.]|uniref:5'-methylthioadenosine/S-adenosylhomocysteine nucleosidase family protein n=1 Tax=Asticcacaulis sp. TaxID=1872648 RepID=UPI003F7BCDDE